MCVQQISPINTLSTNLLNSNKKNINQKKVEYYENFVSFKGNDLKIPQVQRLLRQKGIKSEFLDKEFGANCLYKVVSIFEYLFGNHALPKNLAFDAIRPRVYAFYSPVSDAVVCNNNMECFDSYSNLQVIARENNNIDIQNFVFRKAFDIQAAIFKVISPSITSTSILSILPKLLYPIKPVPNHFSTMHPAHVFVHEFGHTAHYKHMENLYGSEEALNKWVALVNTELPNSVGKLISRYKLSKYATDYKDLGEFIAERVAKDVCENLSYNTDWHLEHIPDVKYESIFYRKWKSKYTSPQAYLDYFTEKVWNGDFKGIKKAKKDIKKFLQEEEQKEKEKEKINKNSNLLPVLQTKLQETLSIFQHINLLEDIQIKIPKYKIQESILPKIETFFCNLTDKTLDIFDNLRYMRFELPHLRINIFSKIEDILEGFKDSTARIFDKKESESYREEYDLRETRNFINPFIDIIKDKFREYENTLPSRHYEYTEESLPEKTLNFLGELKDGIVSTINRSSKTSDHTTYNSAKEEEASWDETVGNFLNLLKRRDNYESPGKHLLQH